MPSVADKRRVFRALHERGCFVIPNPWDVGTARYLQHLGFKALASTSAGFAFAEGMPDNAVTREVVLAHLREIVAATDVPVNADYEGGFAAPPDGVAECVTLRGGGAAGGVAGAPGGDGRRRRVAGQRRLRRRLRRRARRRRRECDARGRDR